MRCRTLTVRRSTIRICIVACVIGDGEAETGPLATSWHSNKFLNPARDGAVLPILHLNGYKIAGPTVLARIPREELTQLLSGYGYEPFYVDKQASHEATHLAMARTLDRIVARIREIQRDARTQRLSRAAALAGARPAHAERMDRSERSRRHRSRRQLALASGAAVGARGEARAPAAAGTVDAQLSARGAVHERRQAAARAARARAARASAAWATTRTPTAASLLRSLRLPDFREYAVAAEETRRGERRGDARPGHATSAT